MRLDISQEAQLEQAVAALRAGELVAIPTETVYGLGADGFNEAACKSIYAAKGRPSDNPLILHIADMSAMRDIAEDIPETAIDLAEAFWPGPLTLVLKKRKVVSSTVSAGLDTVGVRMPDNAAARALIRAVGHPLAAPSANKSGRPSPTMPEHVEVDFGPDLLIVDDGPCPVGVESTIIDLTVTPPCILRPGGTPRSRIEAIIGPVTLSGEEGGVVAPGSHHGHYTPQAVAYLLNGEGREEKIRARLEKVTGLVGLLLSDETIAALGPVDAHCKLWNMGSFCHPEDAAARLFEGIRRMDAWDVDEMYIEAFPEEGLGEALMNRVRKLSQPWPEEA